jgi:hypothetical protein
LGLISASASIAQLVERLTFFLWFWLIKAWARQNQGGRGLLIQLKPWIFFFVIFNFWLLFMYIHVIFNPNQVKKPQGNKVVQYFKILNSVTLYLLQKSVEQERTFGHSKGQLISKCPYEKSVSSKIPTKKIPRFLP